jgi:mannan endo-1,4-beta-mannosidase
MAALSGRGGTGAAGTGGIAAAGGGWGTSGGSSAGTHTSYYVQDGALYDHCGEKVILRGINHPTLYVDREGAALPEIAKTGANSVRLFWFATHDIAITQAEAAISAAIEQQMIPILEMHDSTCEWSLHPIVSYWTSDEAVALIKRFEKHLIVNIANEASANSGNTFRSEYSAIIKTMREAGIHVPLMIDGSRCGRDYEILLAHGRALLDADPDHNLIFSAHLYDPMSSSQLSSVYEDFAEAKLTFVVGEFANKSPPGCGAALSYAALIEQAEEHGVGWLAWSWGNDDPGSAWNTDCEEFDMTRTFAYDSLDAWGEEVAVTHSASIKNTSKRPLSLVSGACR